MTPALIVATAADQISVPSWLNTAALIGILVFGATILSIFLGLVIMSQSKKGDLKKAASQSGVGLIGLFWVALGVGGTIVTLAIATLGFFIR